MDEEIFEILDPGLGATLQDRGRAGWRRFGVPPGGSMDDYAAACANRLLDNPDNAPLIELALQGAKIRALSGLRMAVTGADARASISMWRAVSVKPGDTIHFPRNCSGVWIYLAVEGGFDAPQFLGSASAYPRGKVGKSLAHGDRLNRLSRESLSSHAHPAVQTTVRLERRDYNSPPALRVWRGPQWDLFGDADREIFFREEWVVTSQSDRVGYRLAGEPLKPARAQIISEPVLVGSVQVPENGLPIVTMRDGPTVGGYPKLGVIEPEDLSWLAQCRPGTRVRFRSIS